MATSHRYSAWSSGQRTGSMTLELDNGSARVDLKVDNNGRGMKHVDEYTFTAGFPVRRTLRGNTMVGAPVEERFELSGSTARWQSPADSGEHEVQGNALYLSCENNAFSVALYARLAVDAGGRLEVLPRGSVTVTKLRDVTVSGAPGRRFTAYAVSGVTLVPVPVVVDDEWLPVAFWAVTEGLFRDDLLGGPDQHVAAAELTTLGADLAADVARHVARRGRYDITGPLRINDVHVFDPVRGTLGELCSVTVFRDRIAVIERAATRTTADAGLFELDGGGGTLVPGLHDMHAHIGVMAALLYTTIGVTEVRDLGNDPDELQHNIAQWESGALPGPAVDRSGFIEGESEFSARTGLVVDSVERALDAVRWYAQRGYSQIKIYNSINPEWVPAMAAEAKRFGLRTLGHVPAFTTPKRMIEAGYDELTHVNQLLLGWLLEPGEDSRTMLRLMGLVRAKGFDIDAPEVEEMVDLMRARGISLDTTLMAMEELMRTRPGVGLPAADADYLEHLPVGYQRRRMLGVLPIPPEQADDFHAAFDVLLRIVHKLYRAGIALWPGTDQLYSYTLQRELELYVDAGLSPAEALRTATSDAATHLGTDHLRGTIERGKQADFFLIPGNPLADIRAIRDVRLVVQGGRVYSPHHMHLALGFTPWVEAPQVTLGARTIPPGIA